MHASRVLPGFTPDNKMVMLEKLADEVEIVVVVSALDLARNKVRADLGIRTRTRFCATWTPSVPTGCTWEA